MGSNLGDSALKGNEGNNIMTAYFSFEACESLHFLAVVKCSRSRLVYIIFSRAQLLSRSPLLKNLSAL